MSTSAAPARLHVLLAREAPRAVVIRRGPSRHTAVVAWDRRTDRFELGQWLYGRIYERRCDLSPDGKRLLYFAMNGRWESRVKGSWTAISQAPFLKALTLYAKGDCWHGGGLFLGNRSFWLNDGAGHELQLEGAGLRRELREPFDESFGGECPGVYFHRLQRDGWTLRGVEAEGDKGGTVHTFEKRIRGEWLLRKRAHGTLNPPFGRSPYFDSHELVQARSGDVLTFLQWEWAEVDGGRVVWAENGTLRSTVVGPEGPTRERLLHDFNAMTFETRVAPY